MTLNTGQRQFHFKNTKPTDDTLKPFADWIPVNQNFLRRSVNDCRTVGIARVLYYS